MEAYWIIDPDEPSLTAYDLETGVYQRSVVVRGADEVTLDRPFRVTISLVALGAGRWPAGA